MLRGRGWSEDPIAASARNPEGVRHGVRFLQSPVSVDVFLNLATCLGAGLVVGALLPHPHGGSLPGRSAEAGLAALLFGGAFVLGSGRWDGEAVEAVVPVVAIVGVLLYLLMLFGLSSLVRRRRPLNPG